MTDQDLPSPPVAKIIPHTWARSVGSFEDPYAWLANRDDPDTTAYLEAENRYAEAWLAPHQPLIDTIFGEIKSRTQETDISAPVLVDDWWYVTSTEEGRSYPIYRRGRTPESATEQLVLDVNAEAADHDFFDLGTFDVSPDHRLAAWSGDRRGDEHYELRLRDIDAGIDLDDRIADSTSSGTAWSADGQYIFYVMADEFERPFRVLRHKLGTPQTDDVEIYRDEDERFYVSIGLTRNQQAITISSNSKQSAEVWLVDATQPVDEPRCVLQRQDHHEYFVDHWGDRLVILTNRDAVDFKVVTTPLDDPTEWIELVPHEPARRINLIETFAEFIAIQEWSHAQEQIRIVRRDGTATTLAVDSEPHTVHLGANATWDTTTIRVGHQSLTTPPRTLDIDVATGDITVVKQTPTPNVHLADYVSSRRWATADDGTQIPVDIVRHVDTPIDGTAPCTVYGYGSYEASSSPWFSTARLSLLDRGHIWALVHPRGGGELGRNWYLDGKLLNKRNTFTDTLTCCQYLVASGVAAADRLAIRGGSAGGLLVGACITMRPDLFAAAIAEVPFVDVTTTMSDPSLPLTVTEWEEWGDPRREPYGSYIASYSPYDNTSPGNYPALYINAGLNDPRVSYHEPAKWAARIRAERTNDAPLLLKTEMSAGHAGPSGRYDVWRDEATILTFAITILGSSE